VGTYYCYSYSYCYCYSISLPSRDWKPLCFHHLIFDNPGLRRTGTAPERFATHGARSVSGAKPPSWHPPVMLPTPTRKYDCLTPGTWPPGCPGSSLRWGLALSDCCSRGFAPRATSPLPYLVGLQTCYDFMWMIINYKF
jgi:hypothetical protein